MVFTIVTFLLLLSVLVFVHELGHFWTARRFGVRCDEFGFGFPPRLCGVYRTAAGQWRFVWGSEQPSDVQGTIYSLNWLPLGGFVKIKGEQGEDREEADSFAHQVIWKRIVILSAGVAMNLISAALFLSVAFGVGLPQPLQNLPAQAQVSDRQLQVQQVLSNSPAQQAGIQLGDVIVSIGGNVFTDFASLQAYVADHVGQAVDYRIRRQGEEITVSVVPTMLESQQQAGIGVALVEVGTVRYPWYQAVWAGVKETYHLTVYILFAFGAIIAKVFTGQSVGADVSGPVGIAVATGQVARLGFVYLLHFAALLSINLAIINYLPLPALDGGRVLFLLIEKIRGRALSGRAEMLVHQAGFIALIILALLITVRDILKLF